MENRAGGAEAKREFYGKFGLDWKHVNGALSETYGTPQGCRELASGNGTFRILAKTLAQTVIFTSQTRPLYEVWFDVKRLAAESDDAAEDQPVEETTKEMGLINRRGGWRRFKMLS